MEKFSVTSTEISGKLALGKMSKGREAPWGSLSQKARRQQGVGAGLVLFASGSNLWEKQDRNGNAQEMENFGRRTRKADEVLWPSACSGK